jgi:hypothetical protein
LLTSSHAINRRVKWRRPRRNRIPQARGPSRTLTRLSKKISPPAIRPPPVEPRGSSRKTARNAATVRQSCGAGFAARPLVFDRGLRAREPRQIKRACVARRHHCRNVADALEHRCHSKSGSPPLNATRMANASLQGRSVGWRPSLLHQMKCSPFPATACTHYGGRENSPV